MQLIFEGESRSENKKKIRVALNSGKGCSVRQYSSLKVQAGAITPSRWPNADVKL